LLGNASASSRLGFRGTEDLGKGQSANFNLELGFNPSTGEVTTATRDNTRSATGADQGGETGVRTALVGLADKQFGRLDIGRGLTGIHGIVAGNVWGGNNMVGDMTYSDFKPNAAANAGTDKPEHCCGGYPTIFHAARGWRMGGRTDADER